MYPGRALVAALTEAAFLKFYGYAYPNVFLTTHGCELVLNIFFCPKIDQCFRLNKAPVLGFPSDQRNAAVSHFEVVYKNHDRNYLARWFRCWLLSVCFDLVSCVQSSGMNTCLSQTCFKRDQFKHDLA